MNQLNVTEENFLLVLQRHEILDALHLQSSCMCFAMSSRIFALHSVPPCGESHALS